MTRSFPVTTPDGLNIAAQAAGQKRGADVVFIHGFAQSRLAWMRQTSSAALLDDFHLISYDFRGHGASDKPMQEQYYNHGERYADELNAVLDAADVKRAVLVGWSYGTRIIGDYLKTYGADRVAGINFIANAASGVAEHFGPGRKNMRQSSHEDLEIRLQGIIAFLRACFHRKPEAGDFELMLAYNAMVPREIRDWLRRSADYNAVFAALQIPVLITHGLEDQIILSAASIWLKEMIPHAALSFYEGVGHVPFYEDAVRFNGELAAFVKRCHSP